MGGIVERLFQCAECSRCQKQTTPVADVKAKGWVFPGTDVDTVYCPECVLAMYNESQRQRSAVEPRETCTRCGKFVNEGERCSCH